MNDKIIQTIKETIGVVIQEKVNGKIDRLHKEFSEHKREEDEWQKDIKEHLKKQDEKLEELKPIIESKRVFEYVRKFVLWIAATATIIWAALKYFAGYVK